jgi:hypothetical protein
VAAENRLTAEQLAVLAPGDPVTIETTADFARPRYSEGAVVRLEGPHIVVTCRSSRGVPYVHRFGRRDGVRSGGGHRAELVNAVGAAVPASSAERRRRLAVDAAYRAWARDRGDPGKLRDLQAAVAEALAEDLVTS